MLNEKRLNFEINKIISPRDLFSVGIVDFDLPMPCICQYWLSLMACSQFVSSVDFSEISLNFIMQITF